MTSRPPVQTVGVEVGRQATVLGQFSLAGNGVATYLATCVFLTGNHVSEELEQKRGKEAMKFEKFMRR